MNRKEIINYCLGEKGAWEDYPFGPDVLVMKVGDKMFALLAEKEGIIHLSLKCEPNLAAILRNHYSSVKPGYHLHKRHWNTVEMDGTIPWEEIMEMIDHSYDLVFQSLKKSERELIGK